MGELIVNAIKFGLIIGIATVFFGAIMNIINMLASLVFGNVIGEVLALASMCLPFDASSVFAGFSVIISGLLAFKVAQKIWDLTVIAVDAT